MKKWLLCTPFLLIFLAFFRQDSPKERSLPDLGRLEGKDSLARAAWWSEIHRTSHPGGWQYFEAVERRRQKRTLSEFDQHWVEVGPSNQVGRVRFSTFTKDGQLLLCSDGGGLWSTSWRPSTNSNNPLPNDWEFRSQGIFGGSNFVAELNSGVWVLAKDSVEFSLDQGQSWQPMPGLEGVATICNFQLSGDGETMFVSTRDSDNGYRLLRGTLQNGFVEVRHSGGLRPDFWLPPEAPNTVFLLESQQLLHSEDQGETWTERGSLPATSGQFVTLTGSIDGVLYAAQENPESGGWGYIFRSPDHGQTWLRRTSLPEFWPDLRSLHASQQNPDLVFWGGLSAFRSDDGGASFEYISNWYEYAEDPENILHSDVVNILTHVDETGHEHWFLFTDGGLYWSKDSGLTFKNLTLKGVNNSQIYSVLTNPNAPNEIFSGTQDQGLQFGMASENAKFVQIVGGDYGRLHSEGEDFNRIVAVYPGFILIVDKEDAGYVVDCASPFPENETYRWMPPIAKIPDRDHSFVLAATHLYVYTRTQDCEWDIRKLDRSFQSVMFEYVVAVAISPSDPNRWYVVTSEGRFLASTDGGSSWTPSMNFSSKPDYFNAMKILCDPNDPNHIVVAGNGYEQSGVVESVDGGLHFEDLGEDIPKTLFLDLAWQWDGDAIYAATHAGPFRLDLGTLKWQSILGQVAPQTLFWSVETLSDRMRFGTYGRGVWDFLRDANPLFAPANRFTVPRWEGTDQAILRLVNSSDTNETVAFGLFDDSGRQVHRQTLDMGPHTAKTQPLDLRQVASVEVSSRNALTSFIETSSNKASAALSPNKNGFPELTMVHIAESEGFWTQAQMIQSSPHWQNPSFSLADNPPAALPISPTVSSIYLEFPQFPEGDLKPGSGWGRFNSESGGHWQGSITFGSQNGEQVASLNLPSEPQTKFVMPHIPKDKATWWAGLALLNHRRDQVNATLTVFNEAGEKVSTEFMLLEPLTKTLGLYEAFVQNPEPGYGGWVMLETDAPIFGLGLFGVHNGDWVGMEPASTGLSNFVVPQLKATHAGSWSGVGLVNPSGELAEVSYQVYDETGQLESEGNYQLGPYQKTIGLTEFWDPNGRGDRWMAFSCSHPIMAFEIWGSQGFRAISGLLLTP